VLGFLLRLSFSTVGAEACVAVVVQAQQPTLDLLLLPHFLRRPCVVVAREAHTRDPGYSDNAAMEMSVIFLTALGVANEYW
jgi:hypothetical protein